MTPPNPPSSGFPSDDAPLWSAYYRARDTPHTSLSLPGHKNRNDLVGDVIAADRPVWLTHELDKPSLGSVAAAEAKAATAWAVPFARFSVNGSSAANQAAMLALARPGEPVIVSRSLHKSLLFGLIHTGAVPVWVTPELDEITGLPCGVSQSVLEQALNANPGATAVFLGDPAYVRTFQDIAPLADLAHSAGVPLVVDAAWAGHFGFHPDLPDHALGQGADVMVMSAHKALTGFSQSALILAQGDRVDFQRLDSALDSTQTTSPSAAILASIDGARALLQHRGRDLLDPLIAEVSQTKDVLERTYPGMTLAHLTVDPMAMPLHLAGYGWNGLTIGHELEAHGYELETITRDLLIPQFTLADTPETVRRFSSTICDVLARQTQQPARTVPSNSWHVKPVAATTPREAFFAPSHSVPRERAVGQISADLIAPYPPGIPVIAPGERITREALAVLDSAVDAGVHLAYASDPTVQTLKVISR